MIQILPRPGIRLQALRAEGVSQAITPFVAVVNPNYRPDEHWLHEALQVDSDVTGGCISPSPALSWLGWAVFFSEYIHVAPPMPAGPTKPRLIPGGNVIYRRDRLPLDIMRSSDWELDFHDRLAVEGRQLVRNPAMIAHFSEESLSLARYCRERWQLSQRIALSHAQGIGRWWSILSRTALPPLLLARIGYGVLLRPNYLGRFLWSLPLIAMLILVQTAGEMRGYGTARSR